MVREGECTKAGCHAKLQNEEGRGDVGENLGNAMECMFGSFVEGSGLFPETPFVHTWDTAIGEGDETSME